MYLTRIILSPSAYRARTLLSSAHRLHAGLAASFPANGTTSSAQDKSARLLWRVDTPTSRADPVLYVVSPHGPDMAEAQERIVDASQIATKDYTPLLDGLTAGDIFSFRLTANPTSHQLRESGLPRTTGGRHPDRVRKPLCNHADRVAWLQRKLTDAGARVSPVRVGDGTVPDVVVDGEMRDSFHRRGGTRKAGGEVTIHRVNFVGRLTVTDPGAFRTALVSGVGPAKGYGCGLLTLVR